MITALCVSPGFSWIYVGVRPDAKQDPSYNYVQIYADASFDYA